MAEPVRISVKKGDDVATVVEQLIDAQAETVIIAVAPGALFGQTLANFRLLKREASLLKTDVFIETSDEAIRERAVKAGLGVNEGAGAPEVVAVTETVEEEPRPRSARKSRSVKVTVASDTETTPVGRSGRSRKRVSSVVEKVETQIEEVEPQREDDAPSVIPGDVPLRARRGEPQRPPRRGNAKVLLWFAGAAVAGLLIVGYVALSVLPKATIVVASEKKSWNFDNSIGVDKTLVKPDSVGGRVPGQVFVVRESVTVRVPATGKQYISRKAGGTLTVYNAYSSQPQSIVANTRFVTASGIVFRVASALTIPGAKIDNGKIIPSSIETQVVADKAGVQSNVGPTQHLTIPGFAKTPKFEGFYGDLKDGTTGGFAGETSVPTEKDTVAAKADGTKQVTDKLQAKVASSVPAGFVVLPGSSKVSVTKQTLETTTAADGTVGVTTEAQLSILAFREQDIKDILKERLKGTPLGTDFQIDSETLSYGTLNPKTVALSAGRMTVPVKYDLGLSHTVSIDAVKQKLAGKPDTELNSIIFSIPGITGGKVSLWPFYVHTVPSNLEKITVEVQ